MIKLYVPNIGDGLSAGLLSINYNTILLDCGSQNHPILAYKKGLLNVMPNVFILSHFHADHYNGLFEGLKHPGTFSISDVYYPRIPDFKDRNEYLLCLFAINHRPFGSSSGSMEYDFLNTLSKLNKIPFSKHGISQGDIINLNGNHVFTLWPPKIFDQDTILKSIKNAITDFYEAMAEDSILNDIYKKLQDTNIVHPYINETTEFISNNIDNNKYFSYDKREIPYITQKANKSLKKVANRISLAFYIDTDLLFMGDLESTEIRYVIDILIENNRNMFYSIITPHHGTHWDKSLNNIYSVNTISSIGDKLFRFAKKEFINVSKYSFFTYLQGDIYIPSYCCHNNIWW